MAFLRRIQDMLIQLNNAIPANRTIDGSSGLVWTDIPSNAAPPPVAKPLSPAPDLETNQGASLWKAAATTARDEDSVLALLWLCCLASLGLCLLKLVQG